MVSLFSANLHFLRQAGELLTELPDEIYSTPVLSFHGSTIGGHIRHCLEHYQSFIAGAAGRGINYDCRARQKHIEQETEGALRLCAELIESLTSLEKRSSHSDIVQVQMDCGQEGETALQQSSIGRELQFLVSHTVHHFAMIGGMCQMLGVSTTENFGVAPSTIRHRAAAGE